MTHVNKAKKHCRTLSPVAILPAPTHCQRRRPQVPSAGPWPVTVVTDSSEEEPLSAMLQDPISDAAPAAMTEISLSSHAPIVSSQPSHGRGRSRHSRRIRQTAASTPPRYTSPPDDMYLPNTPPAVDSAAPAFAEHASVPQCSPSSPDAMPLSHPEVFHVPHQFQLDSSGFKWNPLESTGIFEQIWQRKCQYSSGIQWNGISYRVPAGFHWIPLDST